MKSRAKTLIATERQTTNEILQRILEAEKRRLAQLRGFSNTVDWLVGVYHYSESAAYRRMQAARMLRHVPAISESIETGELNLSTIAKAQSVIQREEKRSGLKIDRDNVIGKIKGQSIHQAERTLAQEFPELTSPKNSLRLINEAESRLSIVIEAETRDLLETARHQLSHSVPDGSLGEILKRALMEFVKHGDTARQRILKRAGHRCEWVDPRTKRRCSSTFQIEVDHIHPRALGGSDLPSNLRCLCRQHNLFAAEQAFGREKMDRFRAHR